MPTTTAPAPTPTPTPVPTAVTPTAPKIRRLVVFTGACVTGAC
jgi:hypothetical protein